MMYGYVLSTLIGFVFNLFLYGDISEQKSKHLFGQTIYVLLPGICLYIITFVINGMINTLLSQLLISVTLLLIYYLLILPQLGGLNILSFAGQWINKR